MFLTIGKYAGLSIHVLPTTYLKTLIENPDVKLPDKERICINSVLHIRKQQGSIDIANARVLLQLTEHELTQVKIQKILQDMEAIKKELDMYKAVAKSYLHKELKNPVLSAIDRVGFSVTKQDILDRWKHEMLQATPTEQHVVVELGYQKLLSYRGL